MLGPGCKRQEPVRDRHQRVWRDHVDMVWLHGHSVDDLAYGHHRRPLEQARQNALMVGVHVLDQDESHSRVAWERREKRSECLQTASRSSNADDGEPRHEREQVRRRRRVRLRSHRYPATPATGRLPCQSRCWPLPIQGLCCPCLVVFVFSPCGASGPRTILIVAPMRPRRG